MHEADYEHLHVLIKQYGVSGLLKAAAALVARERNGLAAHGSSFKAHQRTIDHLLDAAYDLESASEAESGGIQLS
jgi:hypothetical protein